MAMFSGVDMQRAGGWSDAIGAAFLKPYKLDDTEATFSVKGTKGPIHPGAKKLGDKTTHYYQGGGDKPRCVGYVSRSVCSVGAAPHGGSVGASHA